MVAGLRLFAGGARYFSSTYRLRMEFVSTKLAPPPAAAYSQATKYGGVLYVSGQVPLTVQNKMIEGDIKSKAQQCFDNLGAILKEGGSAPNKVLKVNVFATDISNFGAINEVYSRFFDGHKPARSFVSVRDLPLGSDVEVEAIAATE